MNPNEPAHTAPKQPSSLQVLAGAFLTLTSVVLAIFGFGMVAWDLVSEWAGSSVDWRVPIFGIVLVIGAHLAARGATKFGEPGAAVWLNRLAIFCCAAWSLWKVLEDNRKFSETHNGRNPTEELRKVFERRARGAPVQGPP